MPPLVRCIWGAALLEKDTDKLRQAHLHTCASLCICANTHSTHWAPMVCGLQTVLHACLHHGLRLLHPFMPFVTEELFHRLALLCGEARSSIMLEQYPMPGAISALRSPQAEDAMETLLKISASIRSLRASYLKGAHERHAPMVYLVCRDVATAATVRAQTETICALAKSSKSPPPAAVLLVPEGCSAPRGCVTEVLDQFTEVHLLLKGIVDLSMEAARLRKEVGCVQARLDRLRGKMAMENYATRCPATTQIEDHAKVTEMEGEIQLLTQTISQFMDGE